MLRTRARMSDVDHGARRVVATVNDKGHELSVGVMGDGTYEDGTSVVDVASWHEFGKGHNPQRSFIRAWFDENSAANKNFVRQQAKQQLQGRQTMQRSLELLGLRAVGGMQKRIASGRIKPPLSEATIRRKGSSVPLVDTGQLRSSIASKVERK